MFSVISNYYPGAIDKMRSNYRPFVSLGRQADFINECMYLCVYVSGYFTAITIVAKFYSIIQHVFTT